MPHRLVDRDGLLHLKRVAHRPGEVGQSRRPAARRGRWSPSVTTMVAQPPSATSSQGCIGKFEACRHARVRASMARARSNHIFIGPFAVRNCSWCESSGSLRHAVTGIGLVPRMIRIRSSVPILPGVERVVRLRAVRDDRRAVLDDLPRSRWHGDRAPSTIGTSVAEDLRGRARPARPPRRRCPSAAQAPWSCSAKPVDRSGGAQSLADAVLEEAVGLGADRVRRRPPRRG